MTATIWSIDAEHPQPRVVEKAVSVLASGGLVAFPTDTYYAIGCDLFDKRAIERIYQLKQLPQHPRALLHLLRPGRGGALRHARQRRLPRPAPQDARARSPSSCRPRGSSPTWRCAARRPWASASRTARWRSRSCGGSPTRSSPPPRPRPTARCSSTPGTSRTGSGTGSSSILDGGYQPNEPSTRRRPHRPRAGGGARRQGRRLGPLMARPRAPGPRDGAARSPRRSTSSSPTCASRRGWPGTRSSPTAGTCAATWTSSPAPGRASWDEVARADVQAHLARAGRGRASRPRSQARALSAIRGLHRLLVSERVAPADPTDEVDAPRRDPQAPPAALPRGGGPAAGRAAPGPRAGRAPRPGHARAALRHRAARLRARHAGGEPGGPRVPGAARRAGRGTRSGSCRWAPRRPRRCAPGSAGAAGAAAHGAPDAATSSSPRAGGG